MMKKLVSGILCMALCMMFAIPVSAAEIPNAATKNVAISKVGDTVIRATNYFTGSTVKMNSLYRNKSAISNISSGSVLGTNPQVTSVSLNVTVSSGSDSFKLYVEDPSGYGGYTTISKSGTVKFSDFNGRNPKGTWKVYIVTNGTVSTATARMTVNYSY